MHENKTKSNPEKFFLTFLSMIFGKGLNFWTSDETIDICINKLFENTDTAEGFTKSELKQLLYLETKESYFLFNGLLYKQTDDGAMRSPPGSSLANAFLSFNEKKLVKNLSARIFYWRYVDDIFVLFKSNDYLTHFQELVNFYINVSFFLWRQRDKINFIF